MPTASGLDAQVGIADETTFGVFVAPTTFIELTDEGVQRGDENIDSAALRPGKYMLGENDWEKGRTGAEGPVTFEVPDRGFAPVAKHMLGKITSTQPDATNAPTVWEHVIEIAPLDGSSFSLQVGRPNAAGVVKAWSYAGGKVSEWEITNEVDGFVTCTLTSDFSVEHHPSEAGAPALAVASFIASQRKLAWTGGSLKVGIDSVPVREVSFSGSNNIRNDRYFLGSNSKYEQLQGGDLLGYEGSFGLDYGMEPAGLDLYAMFVNGTPGAVTAEWTGRTIEDTYKYGLKIEVEAARFNGETPNVGGGDAVEQSIPFDVLSPNSGNSAIKFTITDDQAPA